MIYGENVVLFVQPLYYESNSARAKFKAKTPIRNCWLAPCFVGFRSWTGRVWAPEKLDCPSVSAECPPNSSQPRGPPTAKNSVNNGKKMHHPLPKSQHPAIEEVSESSSPQESDAKSIRQNSETEPGLQVPPWPSARRGSWACPSVSASSDPSGARASQCSTKIKHKRQPFLSIPRMVQGKPGRAVGQNAWQHNA